MTRLMKCFLEIVPFIDVSILIHPVAAGSDFNCFHVYSNIYFDVQQIYCDLLLLLLLLL